MALFKADLHIHSLTSPCASLEMSPVNIVQKALEMQLNIIAITDHNCTKQAALIKKMATEKGLFVLCGAEINSIEEVHCLTFFETNDQLIEFQFFIDQHLPPFPNHPDRFGEQIVVDEDEMIVEEIPYLLTHALDTGLSEIEQKVHQVGGIVVPAHVDRPYNGLFSQLGFLPVDFNADAFELSKHAGNSWATNGKIPNDASIVQNSDAHHLHQIGDRFTMFEMEKCSFQEIKMALKHQNGRRVI